MQTAQSPIEQVGLFKQREKFSPAAWNERGLNPSSEALCRQLTMHFNTCADNLVTALHDNASGDQLQALLRSALSRLKSDDYDTEEKEFIVDLYFELATIVQVDLNDDLNEWLYGPELANLIKMKKNLKPGSNA